MAEKKTKSGKVEKSIRPSWVKIKPVELEKMIVGLAKEGKNPAQIGLELRDKHGIPKSKLLGKKIIQILDENNVSYKSENDRISEKIEKLKLHIGKNKHDYNATRSLTKKLWVLRRLAQ